MSSSDLQRARAVSHVEHPPATPIALKQHCCMEITGFGFFFPNPWVITPLHMVRANHPPPPSLTAGASFALKPPARLSRAPPEAGGRMEVTVLCRSPQRPKFNQNKLEDVGYRVENRIFGQFVHFCLSLAWLEGGRSRGGEAAEARSCCAGAGRQGRLAEEGSPLLPGRTHVPWLGPVLVALSGEPACHQPFTPSPSPTGGLMAGG